MSRRWLLLNICSGSKFAWDKTPFRRLISVSRQLEGILWDPLTL
jgi:hypothetical protein